MKQNEVNFTKESYGLHFLGKQYARLQTGLKSETVITPDLGHNEQEQNKNSENIYIKGDNLDALRHMLHSYLGKIKCIYIDPPYNTGSDNFVYPDKFEYSKKDLMDKIGLNEEAERIYNLTGKATHSAWLTFMLPRLTLARELLSDDGVIFISIDDNEQNNLKLLCDDIFGEENYIEQFINQVRYASKSLNEKDDFQKLVEFCFIYAKGKRNFIPKKPFKQYDINKFNFEIIEKASGKKVQMGGKEVTIFTKGEYEIVKHDSGDIDLLKETWASGSVLKGNTSGKFFATHLEQRKEIDGLNILYRVEGIGEDGIGYRYFVGPQKATATKGRFFSGVPLNKRSELLQTGAAIKQTPIVNFYDYSADIGNIRQEGGVNFRSGKKPVKMLLNFLNISNLDDNAIVLDFFSGSASTAHAVMQLNAEDENGGKRKFIMVQIEEELKKEDEAYKEGYRTICDIGIERIKRAAAKIKQDTNADIDYGFKVYTLNSLAEKTLDKCISFAEAKQATLQDDYVDLFAFSGVAGVDTILQTWKVQDGYGFTCTHEVIDIEGYSAYLCENTLYLIHPNVKSASLKRLCEKLKTDCKQVTRLVVYGYSFSKEALHELESNIKQSEYTVSIIKRF